MDRYTSAKNKTQVMEGATSAAISTSKFVARNTVEFTTVEGEKVVRLHATNVVTVKANGRVILNTGGWHTPTTRNRINTFAPAGFQIYTRDGLSYVTTPAGTFPHVDGAEYHSTGRPVRPTRHKAQVSQVKADKKLIAAYVAEIKAHGVPEPYAGDPFIPPNDKGLYDAYYVREWLKERYVFGSLAVNALLYAGHPRKNLGFLWRMNDLMAMRVRRYLNRCLGYA